MLAVLAEANFVLHAWLRSGKAGAGQGAVQFLSKALSLLGAKQRVRCVKADSGFYADNFLALSGRARSNLHCRGALTTYLKSRLYQITEWQAIDAIYSVSEFSLKLWNWKSPARFVVVASSSKLKSPPLA